MWWWLQAAPIPVSHVLAEGLHQEFCTHWYYLITMALSQFLKCFHWANPTPEKFRVSNSVSGSTIKICSICLWSYCKYFFDIITIEFFSEPYLWTHWFLKNFFVKGKQQLIHAMIFLYEENCLSTGSIQAKVLLQAPCSAQIPITTWLSIKSASDIWNSRLILCW